MAHLLASPHLRGHLLQFDARPFPALGDGAGARLLLAAAMLEVARLAAVRWLQPMLPLWVLLPLLLAAALLAIPLVVGRRFSEIGLRRWGDWTRTERSYFLQVLVIANVVFPAVLGEALRQRLAQSSPAAVFAGVFLPYLCYGFYQELVYRGMLQLELVRRWGPLAGVLAANLLFTFGPLHWHYFPSRVAVPMLAVIFVMGLFFGTLYRRSGNLWLPAVFHALGNAWAVTALRP
jgi:membrane protease YdiL (CAAX protease family)